ncbi:MAG: hypothetical protein K2Y21_09065 [Phycisphaerales bacterium]|nr:hypothetical protein [Phycisphaerales bacterium]
MDGVRRLKKLIADLDGAARSEIALAAGEGRFDELPQLTPMAKEIAGLAARWTSEASPTPEEPARIEATEAPAVSAALAGEAAPRVSAKLKKTDYPQFLREKRDLVKLGWSPREKGPYEHRVPKAGVDAVASAVAAKGKAGHRFTMDEILKALATGKGDELVPSYQTYAVVSWLKWAGMVLQHGRQGYTVVRPQTFASSIETAWQSLPQR